MVWVSPYGSVDTGGTLDRMVAGSAARFGERPALVDGTTGHVVTCSTLASRMERVSAGLAARGFGVGDVLALWAPNMPQWAGVALGAMAAGGSVTGINPAYVQGELEAQLVDSGASVLVTIPALVPVALAAASVSGVREVFVLGEAAGATSILELVGATAPAPEVARDPRRPAFLPYSSGTTGLPKGVVLTHGNLAASVRQLARMLGVTEQDRTLAFVPYFHIMGFMVELAMPLAYGATVVTMPRFDPEGFLAAIEDYRITYLAVPPPVMALLARHPRVDDYDLSSLELLVSGGAPLGADLQRAVARRLPSVAVGQGWGMTETTVGATGPDRRLGTKPGSVGRVMPGTEVRVVDPVSGRDLGADERGELWVRGPQVMAGYLGNPEATAEVLDADGWLRTGDLGYVDGEGNVFVVDRLKDLIKVNAYQVAPAELEALLLTHPLVADAAVVGRPDEFRGEVPVAVVVPRAQIDGDELIGWVGDRVAPYKRLHAVRFAETLPRTPSGKLLRRRLAEHEASSDPADVRANAGVRQRIS